MSQFFVLLFSLVTLTSISHAQSPVTREEIENLIGEAGSTEAVQIYRPCLNKETEALPVLPGVYKKSLLNACAFAGRKYYFRVVYASDQDRGTPQECREVRKSLAREERLVLGFTIGHIRTGADAAFTKVSNAFALGETVEIEVPALEHLSSENFAHVNKLPVMRVQVFAEVPYPFTIPKPGCKLDIEISIDGDHFATLTRREGFGGVTLHGFGTTLVDGWAKLYFIPDAQ